MSLKPPSVLNFSLNYSLNELKSAFLMANVSLEIFIWFECGLRVRVMMAFFRSSRGDVMKIFRYSFFQQILFFLIIIEQDVAY